MEICESSTYDELFREDIGQNINIVFPLVRKCIELSSNQTEVLRAVKISFEFGLKLYSLDDMEKGIFSTAGVAAKKLFFDQIQCLEKHNETNDLRGGGMTCLELLSTCSQIITCFSEFFIKLHNFEKIRLHQLESFLLNCAEIIHGCFSHCNVSEKVYDSLFDSVSNSLASSFRKSCELLELLLSFLTEKMICSFEDDTEKTILCDILTWLSKCGLVLMSLDVKIMAKVWKTHVSLTEKYINHIKECFNAGNVISSLCETVSTSAIDSLSIIDDQEFGRKIKLACFNLKLIIKFCEVFSRHIQNCQRSILNLLLILCRCGSIQFENDKGQNSHQRQELLKQLSFASDPLLSHLMSDEELVKEFAVMCDDSNQLKHYQLDSCVLVCCLVLKKLMHLNGSIRNIWFNENYNILSILFKIIGTDEYGMCTSKPLPDVLVGGKQRKVNDLYQYVLIAISAFTMTMTSKEFPVMEKILLKNVLQVKPLLALLATDIWCLLARFSNPDLCMTQILKLSSLLVEFEYDTFRIEKCHLISLIQRLYPLLTERQKILFTESFRSSPSSELWKCIKTQETNSEFNLYFVTDVNSSFWCQVEKILGERSESSTFDLETSFLESGSRSAAKETIQNRIVELWKFEPELLVKCRRKESILKIICLVTCRFLSSISSENMLMILTKMKKVITSDESTSVSMYFTWILNGLSGITFPPDNFQRGIVETAAEIFGNLLRSDRLFAREKALEVFYKFSHATSHPEIITLSVNNSPTLKCDVTNYFKKIVTSSQPQINLDEFMKTLCGLNHSHVCQISKVDDERSDGHVMKPFPHEVPEKHQNYKGDAFDSVSRTGASPQEAVSGLKANGETLIRMFHTLTSEQKFEITNICNRLLDIIR